MPAKQLLFGHTARGQIAEGLHTLANAVKVTLGPCGRNVLIENPRGAPTISKDGVTVAKEHTTLIGGAENAASVASLMLTTQALIAERPTDVPTAGGQ